MKASIIAVGSELLGVDRLDTNSLFLTRMLERFGVELVGKAVVGDQQDALAEEVAQRIKTSDLVLITGGLGPTADDLTRPAVAQAVQREIYLDPNLIEQLRQRYASFGREMPDANRQQAERIADSTVLDNDRGSAPGMQLEKEGTTLFLFPGVPREMHAMAERALEPWLEERLGGEQHGLARGTVRIACLGESDVEAKLGELYQRFDREAISVLASPGEVRIQVSARGEDRENRVAEMKLLAASAVGDAVFTQEDETLEEVVGRLLIQAENTLVLAESCTGGLVAERITNVAGSSRFFLGGVVSYANELKSDLLGVPMSLIETHGAVSEEVARAMATGGRERLGGDYALAVTGIAGPGGGSAAKPVGTVHMALAGPGDEEVTHRVRVFPGDRRGVRQRTSQMVLDLLRRNLLRRLRAEEKTPAEAALS